jgi:hypothetical protein
MVNLTAGEGHSQAKTAPRSVIEELEKLAKLPLHSLWGSDSIPMERANRAHWVLPGCFNFNVCYRWIQHTNWQGCTHIPALGAGAEIPTRSRSYHTEPGRGWHHL